MGYAFQLDEDPADGVRRIGCEQFDRALDALAADTPDVHDARKCCKRLRGLLRLARPGLVAGVYKRENAAIRDAARAVSGLRDAEAVLEAFDDLVAADDGSAAGDPAALRRRLGGDTGPATPAAGAVSEALESLRDGRMRVADWRFEEPAVPALCAGFKRIYRSGRRRLDDVCAAPDTTALHEWRKQVKYHWYHVRLLEPMDETWLRPRRSALKTLSDALGDDHDLAVLDPLLAEAPAAESGDWRDRLAARRAALQRSALALGRELYDERPRKMRRRCREAWSGKGG